MTFRVHAPRAGRLDAAYPCLCGFERRIVAAGVNPALPMHPAWRDAGPCPTCGRSTRYRVETMPTEYVLHIERR